MNNFVGVVEDIFDPEKLGRVRVRIIGVHTEDKTLIPTADLPWATVMTPTTSPSISGLGQTPYLMMGSWVVGFFHDEMMQDPIIIGSIPGKPGEKRSPSKGFADPSGNFPKWTDDSDLPYSSREEKFEEHLSYTTKETNRIQNLSTAVPPKLDTNTKGDGYYERGSISEPEPSNGHRPEYPFNHVYETHGGHVEEFDDTPENKRYHRYHPAGSYEEIYNDGSRTIKVVGKDYEFVMSGKDIFINGNVNMTCTGSMRQLVYGNYHLEVLRDYTVNVHGSIQQKVSGNFESEIVRSRAESIGVNDNLYVTLNKSITVGGGDYNVIVATGTMNETITKSKTTAAGNKLTLIGGLGATLASGQNVNISASNIDMASMVNTTMHANANIVVTTGGVLMLN